MRGHGEGSIYQRKDGRWAASITVEYSKRKTLCGKTRKEVQEKLKAALHQQQQGTLVTTPQQKVAHFLVHWLDDVHKHSVRPRTYERYEAMIRLHLVPGIGHYPLQKLSPQHLQAFYAKKLKEGLSPTTVISFHKMLHLALKKAVHWGLVPRNVCDAVEPPRPQPSTDFRSVLKKRIGSPQRSIEIRYGPPVLLSQLLSGNIFS